MSGLVAYEGVVGHRRLKPKRHALKYRVFSFLFDLDRLDAYDRDLRWFSRGRFNLFSFYDRDHGDGEPTDINSHIRQTFAAAGYDDLGQILLLCYPRMLGYVFNPVSVYYAHDRAGRLAVMLYEVRNTFGGKHSYLIPVEGGTIDQRADKKFHVSPFNDMDLSYRFALSAPGSRLRFQIQTSDRAGPLLNAWFSGDRTALTDRKLASLFVRYPLMTLKVIAGIHLEAAKLFAKGLRLKPGAPDPDDAVSVVRAAPETTSEIAPETAPETAPGTAPVRCKTAA